MILKIHGTRFYKSPQTQGQARGRSWQASFLYTDIQWYENMRPQHGPQVQVSQFTTSLGVSAVIIWAASTVRIRPSLYSVPIQGHLCKDQNSLLRDTVDHWGLCEEGSSVIFSIQVM